MKPTPLPKDENRSDRGRLRVLLAAPVPPPDHGGIANWTRVVCKEFGKRDDIELRLLDTSVRWRSAVNHSVPARLIGGSFQAVRDLVRLIKRFRSDRIDVFHLCTSGGFSVFKDLSMLVAARTFGVSSIVHYRTGRIPMVASRKGLEWKFLSRAMHFADRVIVLDRQSEWSLKQGDLYKKVQRIPNLVELDAIDEIRGAFGTRTRSQNEMRVIYIGQVLPTKGLRELVAACSGIADKQIQLDVVGPVNSGFRDELIRIGSLSGRSWAPRFVGALDHEKAISRLLDSDVLVLPSHSEGFPNVILEAMACGCPVVATKVGAVAEMLDLGGSEECGIGVLPHDLNTLTAALRRILSEETTRHRFAARARQRAGRLYSAPIVSDALAGVWHEVGQSLSGYRRRAA